MKIGSYRPYKVKKGKMETSLPLKEGKLFFTVITGKGEGFDTIRQEDAEILSRLVKIERLLKKLVKK